MAKKVDKSAGQDAGVSTPVGSPAASSDTAVIVTSYTTSDAPNVVQARRTSSVDDLLDALNQSQVPNRFFEAVLRAYAPFFRMASLLLRRSLTSPEVKEFAQADLEAMRKTEDAKTELLLARAEIDRALAERIRTGAEIEFEESFDTSGKGRIGAEFGGGSANVGLGAEAQRVVSRKITIRGRTADGERTVEVFTTPAIELDKAEPTKVIAQSPSAAEKTEPKPKAAKGTGSKSRRGKAPKSSE